MNTFKKVNLQDIVDLRHSVLRPGKEFETAYTAEDFYHNTYHFGAYSPDGQLIGCVSAIRTDINDESRLGYQIRFMAVKKEYRGQNVGRDLLHFTYRTILNENRNNVKYFWCNARMESVDFYEKCYWEKVGDVFDIQDVGPHIKMIDNIWDFSKYADI